MERRIGLEGLTERLGTRWTDAVAIEAAKEGSEEVSRGIGSTRMGTVVGQRT